MLATLGRGVASYFRGTVGALGIAASGLMTFIGIAQSVRDQPFWMWFCFAALALFAISLFNYLRDYIHREREAESFPVRLRALLKEAVASQEEVDVPMPRNPTPIGGDPQRAAIVDGLQDQTYELLLEHRPQGLRTFNAAIDAEIKKEEERIDAHRREAEANREAGQDIDSMAEALFTFETIWLRPTVRLQGVLHGLGDVLERIDR